VSKLLQNLANGLEFGNKEPAMASFNPFITDNKDKVDAFFNVLAVRATLGLLRLHEISDGHFRM